MTDLTRRARDVAGRLNNFAPVLTRPNAANHMIEAAAIIAELIERIEGKQEGEG